MSDEILLSGILNFLNRSFDKFKTITKISELNDPEYIDNILRDAENNFFLDMNYLPSDSDFNKQYNLRIIYNRISSYYEYVIKKEIEPNYVFDYKDNSDENMLKLGELILGICEYSHKDEYLEVLDNLPENESNEVFKLLSDLVPLEEEKEINKSKQEENIEVKKEVHIEEEEDDDKENEIAMLWIRAENAEKENERLNQEMAELHDKITELTKSNYTFELNLKETESKYKELVSSLKKEETENEKQRGNDMNLSIKISELKGKLDAKTKSFYEYQEEKEKLIDEMNVKINTLRKENLALKEIKVKYDVLQNELKKLSIENMSTIKQRLSQCERLIKEKDEEINRLKSNNNQEILLKKIEELNKQNSLLEEENNNLTEENDNVKQQLALKDCEITQLKENLGMDNTDENNEENKNKENNKKEESNDKEKNNGISLGNLVEEEHKDKIKNEDYLELEQKVAELIKEKGELENKIKTLEENLDNEKKENEKLKETNAKLIQDENNDKNEKIKNLEKKVDELEKEKKELNEKIKDLESVVGKNKINLEKIKEENEKMKQKLEKHKQIKEENKTFVKKIAELMDKLDELKNDNMKLTNEKNEIKNEYISKITKLEKDVTEFDFKLKEKENIIKKMETEREKKKEIDNAEALRLQTLELKNSINSQSNEKLKEIEERLKLLTEKESSELKEQLKEKEMNYAKLEEKYKKLEEELNEMNKAMTKVPEEIKKREDSIEYYKNQLEFKEKTHNEEIRILSSLYHKLSYRFAKTKSITAQPNYDNINL